jgi:ribosomal protein L11 methylase PrmA
VTPNEEAVTDVLAALLAEVGFESFVPEETGMTAYAPVALFSADAVAAVVGGFPLDGFSITYTVENIEGEDWNAEWEKNYFQPIVVDDRCVIHSTFHTDVPKAQYDILIDPKMAFGTGYHQTTCHMLRAILATDMSGKSVLDMGCGTALLAILARMHGAEKVVAIDIDEFAYENAKENIVLNNSTSSIYQVIDNLHLVRRWTFTKTCNLITRFQVSCMLLCHIIHIDSMILCWGHAVATSCKCPRCRIRPVWSNRNNIRCRNKLSKSVDSLIESTLKSALVTYIS